MGGYGVYSVVWDTEIERYHFFVKEAGKVISSTCAEKEFSLEEERQQ